jgi:BirA family transcriptional regulator, biotin operon repressor / biotin---[acetyl-CoA-carboxylase] ligase
MAPVDVEEKLEAGRLQTAVAGTIIAREIVVLQQTTSTNDAILQIAANRPEGLVVIAEHQTAGRGRHGQRWESAPCLGLWLSILLRPALDLNQSTRLTDWAALTVAETITTELSLAATVRSPNDIYVAGRKVAGVLVEMRAQGGAPHLAVAGIGINLNHAPHDFSEELRSRAISLAMALSRKIDREGFAIALLRNLDRTYRAALAA